MIGEIVRPHEYDERTLFERFLERSRASTVPANFGKAELSVVRAVNPQLLVRNNPDFSNPDYIEMGFRLVRREFPTPDLASYALFYGKTVSTFKLWDDFNTQVEPVREQFNQRSTEYQEFLARMAERFRCSVEEALVQAQSRPVTAEALGFYKGEVARLIPILEQINPVEAELKGLAGFSARAILGMEWSWTMPMTDLDKAVLKAIGGTTSKGPKPTVQDLQDVRGYMEDYFSDSQNRGRISLLAQ